MEGRVRDTIVDEKGFDLCLLRHADAGDPEAWSGPEAERPLSAEGMRQAELLGRFLASIGFTVDIILTSPKARAAETAAVVGSLVGVRPRLDHRLAEGVTVAVAESVLADQAGITSALLVGHDPDLSAFVSELCGVDDLPLRKAALARLDVTRPLAAGGATVRWLLPPDALPKG